MVTLQTDQNVKEIYAEVLGLYSLGVKWDPEEEIGRNLKRGLAGVLTDCF